MNRKEQLKCLDKLKERISEGRKKKIYHYDVKIENINQLKLEDLEKFCKDNFLRFRCQEGLVVFVDYRNY